jgi:peroxiredoxin
MNTHPLSWSTLALLTALAGAPAQTAPTRTAIDVSTLGPHVGQQVPDFSLKDQNGKTWTRASIAGPKGAMLVFVRSADWCPYCRTQLIDLQARVNELRDSGYGLAAISYDAPELIAKFSREHGITFPLLSDKGSATITAFGLRNRIPEEALGPGTDDPAIRRDVQQYVSVVSVRPEMVGMAFPGVFMLDANGRVTSRFFEDFYRERSTVSSVMMRLGAGKAVAGTKVSSGQVDVTSYASDVELAPGNRISLAVDIAPHEHMHVYAPGAKDYRVVTLTLEHDPLVRLALPEYPASEIYFFKPLNERVPVYSKMATIRQGLVLEGTAQAQAALRGKDRLTIKGTLDYQACDEGTCFIPVTVSLSWTFTLRALVTP